MSERVFIYTTPACSYCIRAKALLGSRQIPYREVDVARDPALRRWMVQASGRHTVPEVFIDGRPIGGYQELAALDRSGELAAMLAEPPKDPTAAAPHESALSTERSDQKAAP